MPRAQLTLEQRLAKYKISRERFDNESSALLEAGFTGYQAEALIIRQSSSNTVKAVLTNYKPLLVQPFELNHQQIIIIASHDGGSRSVYGIVEKNAAAKDFLYFLNTVLASPLEKSHSQKNLNAPRSTGIFFPLPAMKKRSKSDDNPEDETDQHRDKRPNQGP